MNGLEDYKKCPKCRGLGVTYFVTEGDCICTLCKGKRKISLEKAKRFKF